MLAWLLLVPLLFNVVGASALSGETASVDRLQRTAMVCTAAGMVAVDLDGGGTEGSSPAVPHAGLCAFCLPLMHAGAGPGPAAIAVAGPVAETSVHAQPRPADRLASAFSFAPHPARAPPVA